MTDKSTARSDRPPAMLAQTLRDEQRVAGGCDLSEMNWPRLANAACNEWLGGLVLHIAERQGWNIPNAQRQQLRWQALQIRRANIGMMRQLEEIVTFLHNHKIEVMALKGAALNMTLYESPDLRSMSDLDLLVRPDTVQDTLALLSEYGCRRGFELIRKDFFPKYYYEVEFLTGGPRPVRIDLHVRPFRPLRLAQTMPDDALWVGAQSVSIGNASTWVPCNELMLVHLAAHCAFHGCSRLIWLFDLKRIVQAAGASLSAGASFDWRIVTESCHQWRLSLAVRHALSRATDLLGPFVPAEVMATLAAQPTNWRDRLTLAQAPRDATNPTAHVLVDLLCTPGILFRLGYLGAFFLPDRAHLAGLYPYRHPGWTLVAHAWRLIRSMIRVVRGMAIPFRRIGRAIAGNPLSRELPQCGFAVHARAP